MDEFQQQVQAQKMAQTQKSPPVMYSDPSHLYEEICQRLEHYNSQIDKLEIELRRITLMRNVLAAARMLLISRLFLRKHPTDAGIY
jgi:hypothetical protein